MVEKCQCESKNAGMCCPLDSKLRTEWLMKLEMEHASLRQVSEEIANRLKIISNTSRVEILLMLHQREHCMDEMARKLNIQKSAVSYHLGILNEQGLICKEKRTRFVFYSLALEGVELISLFRKK